MYAAASVAGAIYVRTPHIEERYRDEGCNRCTQFCVLAVRYRHVLARYAIGRIDLFLFECVGYFYYYP